MWAMRNVLDSLLWEVAVDDMGMYPKASVDERGVRHERTPWEDGWNAAIMKITEKHVAFTEWAQTLSAEQRQLVGEMLDHDAEPLWLHLRDGEVRIHLHCGDTFAYACSDAEVVSLEELPGIHQVWQKHGYVGLVAWIARKRQQEPVKEYRYDPQYLAAVADLP